MIELSPGVVLANRYAIEAVLGRGAVAYSYRVKDQQSGSPVALKVMDLSSVRDWKVVDLFEREVRILRAIRHDRIPACIDSFQAEYEGTRLFCIAQSLAAGENLEDAISGGWDPDESEVRRMARELLRLLEYLHGLKPRVVHRDIKPKNIVRDSYGRLSLVDFGSVQALFPDAHAGSTVVGTPGYMAPEQSIGRTDPASDLYSLGMTLVFLLTKAPPHALPTRGLRADFRQRAKVSPAFARWLDRMISPSMQGRFRTATQAREALERPPRRWLPLAGIGAGTAGIALLGAGLAGWLGPEAPLAEASTTEPASSIVHAADGVFSSAPASSRPSSFLPIFGAIDQVGVRRRELVLDAIPTEVDLGRNGEVLAMLIRDRKEVRLIDLRNRTSICSVALGSADVKVAAGADHVVIAGTTSDDVRIYDYRCKLQHLLVRPADHGSVMLMALGAGSYGPVLMRLAKSSSRGAQTQYGTLDLSSHNFAIVSSSAPTRNREVGRYSHSDYDVRVRAAATRSVFGLWSASTSPSGIVSLVLENNAFARTYSEHESAGAVVPNASGTELVTANGVYSYELQRLGGTFPSGQTQFLPPVDGGDEIVAVGSSLRSGDTQQPYAVSILARDGKPLDIDVLVDEDLRTVAHRHPITIDQRVMWYSSTSTLVTLSAQKLVFRDVDRGAAVGAKADPSFEPPNLAYVGSEYKYLVPVNLGRVRLISGPTMMQLIGRTLTWHPNYQKGGEFYRIVVESTDSNAKSRALAYNVSMQ